MDDGKLRTRRLIGLEFLYEVSNISSVRMFGSLHTTHLRTFNQPWTFFSYIVVACRITSIIVNFENV